MKAKIIFNLPEEQNEFLLYSSATKLVSIINNTLEELRKIIKYSDKDPEIIKETELIRDNIWKEIEDNQLSNLFN